MNSKVSYFSIALIGRLPNSNIGIETISIDAEEVLLAGAWEFEVEELEIVKSLISNRLVLAIDEPSAQLVNELNLQTFSLRAFIEEATRESLEFLEEFKEFVAEDPKKRNALIPPDLKSFPKTFEMSNHAIIEQLICDRTHEGLNKPFEKIILAAWMVRDLIKGWQNNERERVVRKFLTRSEIEFRLLPESACVL